MANFNFLVPTAVGNVQDGVANNQVTTVGQTNTLVQQSNTWIQNYVQTTGGVSNTYLDIVIADLRANDYATLQVSKQYTDSAVANTSANTDSANAYTDSTNTFLQALISSTATQTLVDAGTAAMGYAQADANAALVLALANDEVTFANAVFVAQAYTDATNAWIQAHGTNVTPGGADGDIQFNNGGAFGGSVSLHWDGANSTLQTVNLQAVTSINTSTLYSSIGTIDNVLTDAITFGDGSIQTTAANAQVSIAYTDEANTYLQALIGTSSASDRSFTDNQIANNNALFVTPAISSSASVLTGQINAVGAGANAYTDASNTAMRSYVDGISVADRAYTDSANSAMKGYVDGVAITVESNAQVYTDTANTKMQSYVDGADAATLLSAQSFTNEANTYNRINTALALQEAKNYTDSTNTYLMNVITGEGSAITQANNWLQAYASANDFFTLTEAKNYTDVIQGVIEIEIGASANTLRSEITANSIADRAYTDSGIANVTSIIDANTAALAGQISASTQASKDYANTVLVDAYANDYLTLSVSKAYTLETNTWLQLNLTAGGNVSNSLIAEANTWLQANDYLTLTAAQAFTTNTTASILGSANLYTDAQVGVANTFLQANDALTLTVALSSLANAVALLEANDRTTLTIAELYTNNTNTELQVIFNSAISQSQGLSTAYTNAANTFLQANDSITLSVAQAYTDSVFANTGGGGGVSNTQLEQANTWLQANDALTLTSAQAYTDQANTWLQANFVGENTAIGQANTWLQNEKIVTAYTVVVNAGYKDVQIAMDDTPASAQSVHFQLSSGTFNGSTLALTNRDNQLISGAISPATVPQTLLERSVTISGASSFRNHLTNLKIHGDLNIDGTLGRHVFDNLSVTGALNISGVGTGYLTFIDCDFTDVNIGGTWSFENIIFVRCNLNGASITNSAGAIVILTDCANIDTANSTNINLAGLNSTTTGDYKLNTTKVDTVSANVIGTITTNEVDANTVSTDVVVLPGADLSARVTTTNIILANTVLDTFSSTEYRSVKYTVQVTSGSDSQISEILLIHDGTTAFATEYAVIVTNYTLATFAADVVGSEVRLLLTPTNADNTIRIYKTLFNV